MLNINELVGFGAGGRASFTYNGTYTSTTGATVYTFAGSALGAEAADRLVIVALLSYAAAPTDPLLTVTIGGVSASPLSTYTAANRVGFWGAIVPAGTTGDIVLTYTSNQQRVWASSYSLYGLTTSTVFDDANASAANPVSAIVNVPSDSIVLAVATTSVSTTTTWNAALTEDHDSVLATASTGSFASMQAATSDAALSLDATFASGAGTEIIHVAVWK